MKEYYEGITDLACFILEEIENGKTTDEIKLEMHLMSMCLRRKLAEDFKCRFPNVFPIMEETRDRQILSDAVDK